MSSVQNLRDFILQRLSAAAEEIFSLFQKTIEEEMERQRRLLDVSWRPEAHLGGTELSDRFLRKEQEEEELPANQQIWPRGAESGSDQDADLQAESGRRDPATIWTDDSESAGAPEVETKKRRSLSSGPAGVWNSQEEDRPVLKQEADDPTTSDGGPSDGGPSDGALAKPRFQEGCRIDTSGSAALKSEDERIRRRNGGGAALQSELRPVSCDVCGKAFRCNSDMRVHYRVHTGEKPFSCSVCQRAFSLKANLAVHMRTHTGEKPYSCQFCQKGFSDHSSLRKHINVHTGERPYSCAVCGRRFSRSSHMWRHVRVHAAEAPPR